jgi:hypothetical protein
VQAFTEGLLDAFVLALEQFLIDFPEIGFPLVFGDGVKDCWKVIGAAVDDLIVLAE